MRNDSPALSAGNPVPWKPRVDAYFRNMRLYGDIRMRVRFMDKVFKAALDSTYTDAERLAILERLIAESLSEQDADLRCIGLAYAYKVNAMLGADGNAGVDVPVERAEETVMASPEWKRPPEAVVAMLEEHGRTSTPALLESLRPDEEILRLYNVYISQDHFYHKKS